MKLRDYQKQLISDLYYKLSEGYRKIAIIAGTGSGKTACAGQLCADAIATGKRAIFLVHLDVLVGQTYEKMQAFGLDCGFIKAGWPENPDAPIQIASIQTMAKRSWWKNWHADVVIYDEGHITFFSQIGQDVFTTTHPNAVHLPMTATPKRLGKEQFGDYLETLVCSPVPSELQKQGYLAPLKYYSFPGNKLEAAASNHDFALEDLKVACDQPKLIQQIVQEWVRLVPGKRTIAFCVDVEHARNVARAFHTIDVPATVVDGNTPIRDRKRMYDALSSGELQVLASCNVISIGFDEPSVEVGLMLRPTNSSALHFQQLGRVMRISPETGKTYGYILDQANNLNRLGYPEDIRGYALPYATESRSGGIAPTKPCPHCDRIHYTFAPKCVACGYQWPQSKVHVPGPLVEVSPGEYDPLDLIRLFHGHRRQVFRTGEPPEVAADRFARHVHKAPSPDWCLGSLFGPAPSPPEKKSIFNYLVGFDRPKNWVVEEFEKEVGQGSFKQLVGR